MTGMNPTRCVTPMGHVITARNPRRLLVLIERDVETRDRATLHRLLVTDAVKRRVTDLRWAIAAYERIGRLNRKGADAAYVDVLDGVEQLTGLRKMPMG